MNIRMVILPLMLSCSRSLAAPGPVSNAGAKVDAGTPADPISTTAYELGVPMMQTTFKIVGASIGTAFVIGRPCPGSPRARYVLVSAAHVFDGLGDRATLVMRDKKASGWQRGDWPLLLKQHGNALWTRHPNADVGVMYVRLPSTALSAIATTDLLATDAAFADADLRPGDDLLVLGFPLGAEANQAGFPFARVGRVASYPLLPTASFRTFALDLRVFKGNSGGPVIWTSSARNVRGAFMIGSVNWIVGLVSTEISFISDQQTPYETRHAEIQLGLANIVPAPFIREAIEMLPPVASEGGCL